MSAPTSHAIVARHGDVWFASQPSEADLAAWASAGAELVINSRSEEETAGLGFDLSATIEGLGMRYVELPIGGRHGANPALTGQLADLLATANGPVVMHCRSGTRSAHLYAAFLLSQDPGQANPFDTIGWPGGRDMGMVHALIPQA